MPSLKHMVCLDRANGDHPSLDAFMGRGDGGEAPDVGGPDGDPDDLVAIIATGGTTGAAKGVRVVNRSWGRHGRDRGHLMPATDPGVLATAPLTHAAAPSPWRPWPWARPWSSCRASTPRR
ncbi:MAG: hypothetical protein WDM92_05945 [Caulobacteraceae bacterium]